MYGHEDDIYEPNVLLALRLLKFLHLQDPKAAKETLDRYKALSEDELYMMTEDVLWELFSDVEFTSDEDSEIAVAHFSHPVIDRLYALMSRFAGNGGLHESAVKKKIHDATEYFVAGCTHSILGFQVHFSLGRVYFEMHLSPDCYEPVEFANSMIDLLLYCKRETQRLERKLFEETEAATEKEAA